MPYKVFLIGFMASGKSTIGRSLATALHFDFMDTDEAIVQIEGMTIAEIFEKKGEAYFRQKEMELLVECIASDGNAVISTGGGIYADEAARQMIHTAGITFYIYRSFRQTWKIIRNDRSRPLTKNSHKKSMWHLFKKRRVLYAHDSIKLLNKGTTGRIVQKMVSYLSFYNELATFDSK